MLDKITFQNGTIVTKEYLNEVQKGTSFSGGARADFYTLSSTDENSWDITERDGLKDYEISNPRDEKETAIGRLAHDGVILGYGLESAVQTVADATFTEPKTISISLNSNNVPTISTGASAKKGVIVEAGKIVLSDGTLFSWDRQLKAIGAGVDSPTGKNYIYVIEDDSLTGGGGLAVSSTLPSPESNPYVPLAEINFTDGQLDTDSDGDVMGTGVIDLRPNLFVGALNNYGTGILKNTDIISTSSSIKSWDRAIADTRNGSVIISLPGASGSNSASDNDRVAIVDLEGSFDRFPIVLRPGTDTKINGSVDDWIVNIRDAHLELFYNASTAEWRFEETPGSECNPKLGTFISCGGKEFIGTRTAGECPDGQAIPAVYPNPSEGVYRYEASSQKCYKEIKEATAIYSNGEGGLIKVFGASRCNRGAVADSSTAIRNIIYVDPSVGTDELNNNGTDNDKPFRTLERALLEAARASRRGGATDAYDTTVIELAPGDYYVDNSPGVNAITGISAADRYIKQVTTGYSTLTAYSTENPFIVIDVGSANSQPPVVLNLGRVIYTSTGSVGTIRKIEKDSVSATRWRVHLQYVKGNFNTGDEIFYNRTSDFNPTTGGIIVPRGISINGVDLRKVRIRPMYVPALTPGQNTAQEQKTYIFKVTGGTYVSLMTFTDNQQFSRTHNTVTSVGFASQGEIRGSNNETSYYAKITSLFAGIDGWGNDGLLEVPGETTIVAPVVPGKENRGNDVEQNQTGTQSPDLDPNAPPAYPGPALLKVEEGGSVNFFKLPDVNSTRSSSPYVFNCSVRSIFGLQGLWADGTRVGGFKSMVTANYTQVSLQTDPNCFEAPSTEYFSDPPINKQSGSGKKFRTCSADEFKYRHFGFRGSADATIQLVSCFVIGNADHFIAESGADLSITNSCSDFGDISLRSIGFKEKAFSQDEGRPTAITSGTKIIQVIPPLPLSSSPLSNGKDATLRTSEVSTGLNIDYTQTKAYVLANKVGNSAPSVIRVYIRNSDIGNPFSATNVPSASLLGFGQFSYTRKAADGTYYLSGGAGNQERKTLYVAGFDENGNSILYAGEIQIQDPSEQLFNKLDDQSKIFGWDTANSKWYINIRTSAIPEESTDGQIGDVDGYLQKKYDYAFRYILDSTNSPFDSLDFIFDGSPLKVRRAVDRRTADERVYRVVLDGFLKEEGLRKPQAYYVLEKQQGVAGFPLNGGDELLDDPLVVTDVRNYHTYSNPGVTYTDAKNPFPGKYITYMTTSADARDVFTADFVPEQDLDEPEATADPSNSVTKVALQKFGNRPNVVFSEALGPSVNPIQIRENTSTNQIGFLIGLHRPSVVRASGHTWEWTGYLNYDTAFPIYQGEPLEQDFKLGKIIVEETGGRVYASGMNEEGNFYIGTNVYDLKSGEQFSIPLKADNELGNVTNQVLNNVIVKGTLFMNDDSTLRFGPNTTLIFNSGTELRTDLGPIQASTTVPDVYATTERAGFVELASQAEIRGAFGNANTGIADKVVVTAAELAAELNLRLDNVVNASGPLTVSETSVEAPGGDPNDDSDNITQFTVQLGLDADNQNEAKLAGLRLGSTTGQLVTSVTNNFDKSGTNAVQQAQLVSARALRLYQIDTDQLVNGAVETAKINDGAVTTGKLASQAVTSGKIASGAVTEAKIGNGAVTNSKIANDAVNGNKIADDAVDTEHIANDAVDTAQIANNAVETAQINNGAVTAAKLSGGQGGSAPVYGIRAFGYVNASGNIQGENISGNTSSGNSGTINFAVAMPNNNYTVVTTSSSASDNGDHVYAIKSRSNSSFEWESFDPGDGNNQPDSNDGFFFIVVG
ncbi:tail fiber [Cyanophage S-TIM61]|nr:tail fiber [Cyanophage S-TIM61]